MLISVERSGSSTSFDLVPSKIIGIGQNYSGLTLPSWASKSPTSRLMFLKPRSSLLTHGGAIERPSGYERVDYEGELGVVIGKRTKGSRASGRSTR